MFDLTFFLMADPEAGGGFASFFFLIAIFFVFWFFIIRPQSKKQKETQQKVEGMKKGDKILTSGGIYAIISSIEETTVLAEVDKDVKIRFSKSAIVDVNPDKDKAQ